MKKGTLVTLKKNEWVFIDDESLNLKSAKIKIASSSKGVVLDEADRFNYIPIRVTLDNITQFHGKKNKSNLPKIHIDFKINVDDLNIIP